MKNLVSIGKNYPSNKNKSGFLLIYENYFKKLRLKKINILEIGIDKGDSLRIWRDYFPNANICGVDIKKKNFKIKGVDFFIGDQSNNFFLKTVIDKYKFFDIIIDDGSHLCKHIISSFNFLYPYLNNSGLYIIEDLQTSYMPRYGGSRINLRKKTTSMNYLKQLCDSTNYEQFNRPFYKHNKFDGLIKSINFHQNIVFINKGTTQNYYYPNQPKNTLLEKIKRILSKLLN